MSKSIVRSYKRSDYVCIDNAIFENEALSWAAKGLLGYLLSKPGDWQIQYGDLQKRSIKAGRDATRTLIKELIEAGYVDRQPIQDARGRMSGWEWRVFENPTELLETRTTVNPQLSNNVPEVSTEGSLFHKEEASIPPSSTDSPSIFQTLKTTLTAGGGTQHPIPQPPLPLEKKKALERISLSASQHHLIPSSGEMLAFAESEGLGGILEHKEDIWDIWMKDKWHIWKGGRWVFRRDWKSALIKYNTKLESYKTQ